MCVVLSRYIFLEEISNFTFSDYENKLKLRTNTHNKQTTWVLDGSKNVQTAQRHQKIHTIDILSNNKTQTSKHQTSKKTKHKPNMSKT